MNNLSLNAEPSSAGVLTILADNSTNEIIQDINYDRLTCVIYT